MEPHEWKSIEPHVTGIRAIHSPRTGIVDWGVVASHYSGESLATVEHIHLNGTPALCVVSTRE